ncbi:MAG: response regulator [Bacteroidota bacterium]
MSADPQFHATLEAAAAAFSGHLVQQLDLLETTWQHFLEKRGEGSISLNRLNTIAHNLYGQGTFFGYPEVTQLAGKLVASLNICTPELTPPAQEIQASVDRYINQLKQAAFVDQEQHKNLFRQDTITAIESYKESVAPNASPRKILVIEDADLMRRHIVSSFQQAGFLVYEAAGGLRGIALATQHLPDLILLDIKMPEVDGFAVQQKIRTHDDLFDVPLIFLTSLSRVTIAQIQTALAYGVTDYISKPFNMSRLIEKVKCHLT